MISSARARPAFIALCVCITLAAPAQARLPIEAYVFPTARSCQDDLDHLRHTAFQKWRFLSADYYERLQVNPEPQDDSARAELWMAYARERQARRAYVQLRDVATCERNQPVAAGNTAPSP